MSGYNSVEATTIDLMEMGVDWQYIEGITTKSGNYRPVLFGIPQKLFWHHWKHGWRDEYRRLGVILWMQNPNNRADRGWMVRVFLKGDLEQEVLDMTESQQDAFVRRLNGEMVAIPVANGENPF
jgi:hypothetical protein